MITKMFSLLAVKRAVGAEAQFLSPAEPWTEPAPAPGACAVLGSLIAFTPFAPRPGIKGVHWPRERRNALAVFHPAFAELRLSSAWRGQ